jgi:MFS family permease
VIPRDRRFLRLLVVRVTGQTGDGVFQAALATYALFGDDVAGAADLAAAAAVVLLPWSLLGPLAGVALDRWSRRQVLLLGNLGRGAVLVLLAGLVAADAPEPAVYAVALLALGVNRFLLAALSASLPHTVAPDQLTEANAVAPTVGTGGFVAGLGLAALLRSGVVGASLQDPGLLVLAAAVYGCAGASSLLLPRRLLGPDRQARPATPRVLAELWGGLVHLAHRRHAAAALSCLASMRLWFGLVTVSGVLVLRNATEVESEAVSDLGVLTLTTGAGFLAAALTTPGLARLLGREATLRTGLLIAAGCVVPLLLAGEDAAPAVWWTAGAVLGLGAQTTKICVDAIVQAEVDDEARGRVFSLYDMAFNVSFVLAAAIAALVLPASGRSSALLVVCGLGLALSAAAHHVLSGPRDRPAPRGERV